MARRTPGNSPLNHSHRAGRHRLTPLNSSPMPSLPSQPAGYRGGAIFLIRARTNRATRGSRDSSPCRDWTLSPVLPSDAVARPRWTEWPDGSTGIADVNDPEVRTEFRRPATGARDAPPTDNGFVGPLQPGAKAT